MRQKVSFMGLISIVIRIRGPVSVFSLERYSTIVPRPSNVPVQPDSLLLMVKDGYSAFRTQT
jgi:hypothetical protein